MQALGNDRGIKNKWLWEGMQKSDIEILNVAENDIAELRALGVNLEGDRFISANLVSVPGGEPLLKPYVVREFVVHGNSKKCRLGFLGLSSRASFINTEPAGYTWADPLVSAKKWLPELRQKCDFLIVLACMPARVAVELAVDNSNIDLILNGFQHQGYGAPAKINQSMIAYAEDEGRALGELRFKLNSQEKFEAQPVSYFLTRDIKDDPGMAALISQAKPIISAAQQALVNASDSQQKQPATSSDFVGAASCSSCHAAAFEVWAKSGHSHAIETLKQQKKEFDTSCVVCHVTGANKPGGFVDLKWTPELANVQCEACHGSGRAHSQRPAEAKMARLTSDACVQCHTRSNSPEFEFASYWEKIKH